MLTDPPLSTDHGLLRVLCIVVFATMVLSAIYAAWIGIVNFSRIGV